MDETHPSAEATLRFHLQQLSVRAESIWRDYLANGPGRFPSDAFAEVAETIEGTRSLLDGLPSSALPSPEWIEQLNATIAEVDELLRKCVERTEGLCFITGEAGLIPRRDLYDRCETALQRLRLLSQKLDT